MPKLETFGHTPIYCQIPKCEEEATRWYHDPKYPNLTFYFCLEHPETEEDEEIKTNSKGENVEVAVFQCDPDCQICE